MRGHCKNQKLGWVGIAHPTQYLNQLEFEEPLPALNFNSSLSPTRRGKVLCSKPLSGLLIELIRLPTEGATSSLISGNSPISISQNLAFFLTTSLSNSNFTAGSAFYASGGSHAHA